jgi:cysteine-rich repeat protein
MRRLIAICALAGCGSSPSHGSPDARPSPDGQAGSIDAATGGPDGPIASSFDAGSGYCGDHIVNGLEGCDDGNHTNGDGCSSLCVVESTKITPFATIDPQDGVWMTVGPDGTTYIKQASGTGAPDSITSITSAGVVTPNLVTGILSTSGGDIVAVGQALVFGGVYYDVPSSSYVMTIQEWYATSGIDTLFSQAFAGAGGGPAAGIATNAALSPISFSLGDVYTVTGATASALSHSGAGDVLDPIQVDRFHDELLAVDGAMLLREVSPGAALQPIFTAPDGLIGKIAVDGTGRAYATCYATAAPCASGAVWVIAADGQSATPFIDSSAGVYGLGWDPSTNELVYLADDWGLRRVPL